MLITINKGTPKDQLDIILKKLKIKKGVDTKKYCGVIKLKQDALEIQKELRNEWR